MFSIRYRLIGDEEQLRVISAEKFEVEFGGEGIPGDIELKFGAHMIGPCREGILPKEACGWEDIDRWVDDLLKVLWLFENGEVYAAFRMIEYDNRWLEFYRKQNIVVVNEARGVDKASTMNTFITKPIYSFLYYEPANCEVQYATFREVVLKCAQKFIREISSLNPQLNHTQIISSISNKTQQLL